MPLRVEKLFQEYNTPGSFAVASLLTLLALVTLAVKVGLEHKTRREAEEALSREGEAPAEPKTGSAGASPSQFTGISKAGGTAA
jgi:sulfate transport system permease protein